MMKPLGDILDSITAHIQRETGYANGFHGLAKLVTRDNIRRPVIVDEHGYTQEITPDDTYELQVYYRLVGTSTETDDSRGMGAKAHVTKTHNMLMVGLIKQENAFRRSDIPEILYDTLLESGIVTLGDLSEDSEEILNTEFNGADLTKLISEVSAFTIEFQIVTTAQRC